MSGTSTTRPPARQADPAFEQQLREMNEALLLSAVRQQELAEQVEKANAVVRESEERYHTLFDLVPIGVYSCVTSGVIQTFNRRAVELWGREPAFGDTDERFCGSFKLFRPDGSLMPHDQCPMAEVLSGKIAGVRDAEVLIERPDGSRVSVVVNIHPLKNQRGEVTGAINCFYDITERKQAEAVNATLAAIIQSSDDAIISKTLDGIITSWNKSAERMFAYTEAEAVGQNISLIIPEERRLEEDDLLACLRRGEKIENFQTVRQTKDGRRLDISMTVSPIKTAAGQTIGASKIARDITERKRVQDALWESEHRLRFVMDSAPQKIFTAQPDGNVDYFNPQWTEFTGLSFEQIKGWGWKQFIHPADLDENVRAWRHSIDTGEPFQFEHRFRRADGEYRWHVSRAMPMRDEAGRITMWVGSNTDVHDIKQAEQALHNSEFRYRRLFEATHDGILILDAANGTILDANPYMSELLGYSHDEFLGKELWEIGLFYDKSASEVAVRELQEKSNIRYEHLPLETNLGRKIEVEVVANVYREEHRSVIQCNIRDITERSLLQRKLSEQAVALTDLHRRKDEFLAMLSHELRNPLAPITNAVQLLRLQNDEDPVQQQARAIIERQVGQLVRLVDDLLEISRINTGRIHLHQERITLDGIVNNAVETVRPLIGQRRHSLETSLPPQPIWLYGDAARLEQVVVNLLTNAAKYMDEGGHIWLTVEQEGDQAVLRVRDTGVGIAPELLPRIFDLFTQAERSLDRSQGGLGIGLSLVQRLAEMHRGTVEVYSVLGQGSEFVVRLPVVLSPAPLPASPSEQTTPTGSSLRVLVVDDNVDVTTTLAMLLELSGHEVRKAYDGPAALEAALDFRPNVVLLDIGLPRMNGFEVAQQMRQQPELQNVVLVAMTGYGQESDRRRSLEAGFDHHLVKPADFAKLQQILAAASEKAT